MVVEGIIIVDKPAGPTSHDVVARVRRILKVRRVGHTGTLDPFATGVLVICVGRATRLVQFLVGSDKEYLAEMRLGLATDTGDPTGKALPGAISASEVTEESIVSALDSLTGPLEQVPPMFAAKKVGGQKLYELARRGIVVERQAVNIRIEKLELIDLVRRPSEEGFVDVQFRVVCSSGTCVRSLAIDIGQRVGLPAHLLNLRRTRAGLCEIEKAVKLDELEKYVENGQLNSALIRLNECNSLLGLPVIELDDEEVKAVSNGRTLSGFRRQSGVDGVGSGRVALVTREGRFAAVAEFDADKSHWHARVVLHEEN